MIKNEPSGNKIKRLEQLSKSMSYILRHKAQDFGIPIDASGFVKVDDLLKAQPVRKFKADYEMIKDVVELDKKGRYELKDSDSLMIRAVQGHSMKIVKNEEALEQISNIWRYPIIVHGTYEDAWMKIKETGLNRMSRNAIHFSIGYSKAEHVKSGMRNSCDVFIEINAIRAYYENIKFFCSKNRVILTTGIEGELPVKYFKKVTSKSGKILFSQSYEVGCFINNAERTFSIIDITNEGKILHKANFDPANSLDLLPEYFIRTGLSHRPFIVIIPKEFEQDYVYLITNKQDHIKHIGFYIDYFTTDSSNLNEV